jgi:hypothetical protein
MLQLKTSFQGSLACTYNRLARQSLRIEATFSQSGQDEDCSRIVLVIGVVKFNVENALSTELLSLEVLGVFGLA